MLGSKTTLLPSLTQSLSWRLQVAHRLVEGELVAEAFGWMHCNSKLSCMVCVVRKFKVALLMLAKISIVGIIDAVNDLVWPG